MTAERQCLCHGWFERAADVGRQPLRERVDASTCLQLERTAAEAGPEAEPPPALIVRASAGQPLAVAAITLLSEVRRPSSLSQGTPSHQQNRGRALS